MRNAAIVAAYQRKTPGSARLSDRAREAFPGGVTHDTRLLEPYPLAIARAKGARKWDVDGNEYVDYIGGHGALLLGHAHPVVSQAITEQLAKGTHYGAAHELEIEWGEQVKRLVPCAQKVRFTGSGTESTLLAIRLARAFTGKNRIIRFAGHFHGWHDQVAFGVTSHFDGSPPAGVLPAVAEQAAICPPNDMPALERMLDQFDDVAAVIMEPTGATFGLVPLVEGFAARVRQATARKGVLLIFDEVITGFRVAAGGAQQLLGVTPDLATFAKIIAGGLPGGAVAGRADVMDTMTPRAEREWNLRHRVPHQGTFNANPLTAAAGLATLKLIEDGRAIADANQAAAQLRDRLNELLKRQGSPWVVYGASSGFHVFLNPREREVAPADIAAGRVPADELKPLAGPAVHDFRCGLIVGGVDLFPWPGGCVSAVHGDAEIEATVRAFQTCLALALDKAAV